MVERCSTIPGVRWRRRSLRGLLAASACVLCHCGGGAETTSPVRAPSASAPISTPVPAKTASTEDPFKLPARLREDVAPPENLRDVDLVRFATVRKLPGVSAPACPVVAPSGGAVKKPACERPAMEALTNALRSGDAALAELESCPSLPPGLVRALRAEVAKPECADQYVDDFLEHPKQGTPPHLVHVMAGQSVAAKLLRTGTQAPAIQGPISKEKLVAHINTTFAPWFKQTFATIDQLSQFAVTLQGYGKAIAATEAGYAELRVVETIRTSPKPQDWDAELKLVYEGALEDALAPMKAKGRDATLVGFGIMAMLDLPASPRVSRARNLLARMYGGRRIDALDALMFGQAPRTQPEAANDETRTQQSATYFLRVISPPTAEPEPGKGPLADRLRAAERRLLRGSTFWRAVDYDRVLALVGNDANTDDTARLYTALALALRQGPVDALHFMSAQSPSDLNLLHTEALDQLAGEKRATSGVAAFDAALLHEIAPPATNQHEHFIDVAQRYEAAASMLVNAPQSAAKTRAEGARTIAAAIREKVR